MTRPKLVTILFCASLTLWLAPVAPGSDTAGARWWYRWPEGVLSVTAHDGRVTAVVSLATLHERGSACSFSLDRPIPVKADGSFRRVGRVVVRLQSGLPSSLGYTVSITGKVESQSRIRLTYAVTDGTACVLGGRAVTAVRFTPVNHGGITR